MNIVKGVADLIRRTSSISSGESSSSGSSALRFPPPSPKICFSEVGDEGILRMLWDKYENAVDEAEKKKMLIVFLEQFLAIYKHWEPSDSTGHSIEAGASTVPPPEYPLRFDDVIVGCSSGHPAEIILTLTEEVPKLTMLVADFDNSGVHFKVDLSGTSRQTSISSDGLLVLEALAVINRSMHNCRVFGYYGGIQKLTALMKGAIVQLKAITGALTGDESLANATIERTSFLQKILMHAVLIMHSFIDLNSTAFEKSNWNNYSVGRLGPCAVEPGYSLPTEPRLYWHHKAVVSVMEAGGLNWLVGKFRRADSHVKTPFLALFRTEVMFISELLRVIRRLNMKNLQIDVSLQYLTLRVLLLSLSENPRGQNHFKSIGGLEVLLDGLVLSSSNSSQLKGSPHGERDESPLLQVCQLHMLCMMVLKEAIYANLNNLQFLCENGRIQKFANSFCSLAFLLQEYQQMHKLPPTAAIHTSELRKENHAHTGTSAALSADASFFQLWSEYVVKLSRILCSFVVAPENTRSHHVQANTGRVPLPISSAYGELSIKWFLRVLRTIFPCIKACSNQDELPNHLRVLVNALQHCALDALKNVLVSSPASLDIFREEGLWDLLFSENFFHFEPAPEQVLGEYFTLGEGLAGNIFSNQLSSCADEKMKTKGVEILQTAVISFVEFAATSKGISHNQPELSALIDALEQCAYHPANANVLAKSMVRVIQLSAEKTIVSLRTLDIIPRLLHVICMQAEESRRFKSSGHSPGNKVLVHQSDQRDDSTQSWLDCVESCMGLFDEFVSAADDARSLILRDSASIDCLFNLFWDGSLRSRVLRHIFDLMKMLPLSTEDQKAKLHLCSKYLEMFTQIKEGEKNSVGLSIELLIGMREMLTIDRTYYQALFRDGECFLHVVSLLNGNLDELNGEKLVLNVLRTLTSLLANNDESKASFRALVGKGYQTMQSLLLDFCQWNPSESLLNTLLDMLVDGTFEANANPIVKNEDVVVLYLSVLQKSSDSSRHYGLNVFLQLLRDSISNRASCVRAGIMSFLLDWFAVEGKDNVILKIAQLVQVIGGHSISGKDIRKIFALLRSEKVGARQQYCSLLLTTILAMLNEKGPMSFFDLNGNDSGIIISTPFQWPLNKGFSFSCWLRVESFPSNGTMGLFQFLTEDGKGCSALLGKNILTYESINLKQQSVQLSVSLVRKKWHFLCLTHSIGRTFSGGSLMRCYVDGELVSSERCRYPKVNDSIVNCAVGMKSKFRRTEENNSLDSIEVSGFYGQIGPVYLFSDAISPEQVQGIYSLGPSYMYSFLDNEASLFHDEPLPSGVLDARDGLTSKIVFGLNAQASDGKILFNVLPVLDHTIDKKLIKATVMPGTQLCSRRLLQQILYCVGGISVFFPIIAQSDRYDNEGVEWSEHMLLTPITKDRVMAEVIELIASVLDDNLVNQKQMHLLSGFPILGFLLQSVPPEQLNLETFSALKHLFNISASGGLADLLVEDAVSSIFLNPLIWVFTDYNVQRELYMFLIQVFDNNPMLLRSLCRLPYLMDTIQKFYWDHAASRSIFGSKPLLHPVTKTIIGERPRKEDIQKIRLLILSLGEMSLRQNIAVMDIKSLLAFFETSQDMQCIEDVLHMVIRAISQREVLFSFLEQVNLIGGSHIFINLLQREHEPIRLLSLQFLGKLLVGLPSEKKGPRLFSFPMGKLKSLSESHKKFNFRMQPIFSAVSDRLFGFPLTDNLCATLFDVLLGGASPKQVLQKHGQSDKKKLKGNDSHFVLPQILVLIFRFLSSCEDESMRVKVVRDLLHLLDSNSSNVEALMEHGWNAWLTSIKKLDMLRDYRCKYVDQNSVESAERNLVRTIFVVVLGHYICSVKGGWQQFEDTVNFLLLNEEQGVSSCQYLLRDILEGLTLMLLDHSSEGNIFASQPCRDNMLFLLQVTDEMLVSQMGHETLFPAHGNEMSLLARHLESPKGFGSALYEVSQGEIYAEGVRNPWCSKNLVSQTDDIGNDKWWSLYDNIWSIISAIYGKGSSKVLPKPSTNSGPSFGQRARGLVESLNVPAAEMAAVVVSGGIGNALGGKPNKTVDRAMLLRGERCPRILFRLTIFYLCKSSLERASRCVQQVLSLLPSVFVGDEEQTKSKLHLFIWELLAVRSQYGALDDGARFHVISHLIRETVSCGKFLLATSIAGRDEFSDSASNSKDSGLIDNLIQKDRVLLAVSDEAKYVKASMVDRSKQLEEFQARMDESFSMEAAVKETFEEDIRRSLEEILAWDDARRAAALLTIEEQHQNTAEKWIHIFRTLIDERGPWSARPFPDCPATYWKLDKTEDSWRRRQKLRQNYHFDDRLCHPPSTSYGSQEPLPSLERKSSIAGHIPDQMKRFLLKGIRKITDESSEDDPDSSCQKESLSTDSAETQLSEPKAISDQKNITRDIRDSSSLLDRENNEVLRSIPCVLVTPKRKVAGNLAVMRTVLHFFGEFLVEGTGGSSVFTKFCVSKSSDGSKLDQKSMSLRWLTHTDSCADNVEGADGDMSRTQLKHVKRHRRWNIGKIKAVHWTRYLLRNTAIEILFRDSVSPIFLNFASQKEAKEVGTLIVATRNEFLFPKGSNKEKNGIISFIDRRLALEMAENARESWRRREITNFEYLMILNTLSGRSYNDLTQYPVFPWVLADYSSEVLDFNKSSTFRDLTKPVGALDLKRLEVFEDRYLNFSDPDIPSFYYGSHYSSMGIVLYYLLRLEPYTSLHRSLQGGKFDHADRLFQSIEGTYKNCLSNTSDVKELIPEFFYMPEFLFNSNSYHLGVKQDGDPIDDVCLPPWAKGSPELFVSKNREALESEYVSSNLHHWIDLVFGYAQRGKPAVEAANIFYYLTYEGAVDLESMEDELQRSAIEDQIANFGQTPIQIFRKKHPRRGPPIPIAHPLRFAPASISLTSVVSTTSNPSSGVLYVQILESTIVLVNQGPLLSVKMWLSTQLHSGGNFTFSGFQDPLFGVGSDILSPRKIGSPLAENAELGPQCFETLQTPAENFLISCGNWENSFQVSSLNDGRTVQSIRQHKDVVSCVAVTEDGSVLATGSYDTTVMVWDIVRSRASDKRVRGSTAEIPRKDYVIAETPFHILCGHDDVVTCLFASMELDIVVSASKDGTCIFHTMRKGTYVRSVRHPTGCALSKLAVSRHGRVAVYADDDLSLHLYSINGKHLATCESNGRLNCIEVSKCGEFLVCAGDQGQIILRSMETLDVVSRYNGIGRIITCLTVTPEECILAGTKDGSLLVYSIENPQLRRSSISRNAKTKSSAAG